MSLLHVVRINLSASNCLARASLIFCVIAEILFTWGNLTVVLIAGASDGEIIYPFQHAVDPFFEARDPKNSAPLLRGSAITAGKEVVIGYFGPSKIDDLATASLWWAAQRGLKDAERDLRDRLPPCRLVPLIKDSPWSDGASALAQLIFRENVAGVIGGMDGETTHLAETIVAKAHLPLLSPVATDKTTNLAGVPWIFALAPGDHLIAPILATRIVASKPQRIAVLLGNDHDSQWFWRELNKCLLHFDCPVNSLIIVPNEDQAVKEAVRKSLGQSPDWLVVSAPQSVLVAIIREIRCRKANVQILCDARISRVDALKSLGKQADGIICPFLMATGAHPSEEFREAFQKEFGVEPDYAVLLTYDAVRMLLHAIAQSVEEGHDSINRVEVYKRLVALSPYRGIFGTIEWDKVNANKCRVVPGIIRNGKIIPELQVSN